MEDKKILETEKPEIKKEAKSESSLKNEQVEASPVLEKKTKPEVSIADLEKLYKVIEKQNEKLEKLTKKEVKKEVKKTERPTNIVESSEKPKIDIDKTHIFKGVFVK